MKTENVVVGALRPYGSNARTHSKKQIGQIAKSIKRFGFCNPVLIDDDYHIIAGHGRVAAAKLLEIDEVPVVRLSHLSSADKRAYVLADNKLAENAGWDREILAIELQGLIDLNFDLDTVGFDPAEIDLILEDALEAEPGAAMEDEVPGVSADRPVSELGDIWQLGKHGLVCGDARDEGVYRTLLGETKAEFVFTDPPYNVPIDGHVSGLGRIRHAEFAMASGEMTPAQFTTFLTDVFSRMASHSVDGAIHQICIDWRHLREMMDAGEQIYSELKNLCVWNKNNAGMGSFYRSKHELVFVWKSGTASHVNNFELGQHGRSRSNVWDYAGVNTLRPGRLEELAMHPTVKPVALVADAIKDCSRHGSVVLDPFAGSGTILIAAERTGRKAKALEIDPRYVDVAIKRWQNYTGKNAMLCPMGETFEEARELRRSVTETG